MKWPTASLIVLSCLVGCHAPTPSFNVLAPYGSSRVPPPATATGQQQTPYYTAPNGATGSSVTPATVPTANQRAQVIGTSQIPQTAGSQEWQSVQPTRTLPDGTIEKIEGDVRLAAYNSQTQQKAASDTATDSSLRRGGMTVNDATQITTPPSAFVPPTTAAPIPGSTNNVVSATAKSSDQSQPKASVEASTGTPTLNWGG